MAGVPGVTEALFMAKQSATVKEKDKNENPLLYSCALCGKSYKSSKAHAEHLKSLGPLMRASQGSGDSDDKAIVQPLSQRVVNRPPPLRNVDNDVESGDEWEEVDSDIEGPLINDASTSMTGLNVNEHGDDVDMDEDGDNFKDLEPTCCFMCDRKHHTIESCIVHLHKKHGLFIPDAEYLKNPEGLLTYLGLKVMRDYTCLYCNERCHPFGSLEAVRKHMAAKSHCKMHYGGGGDDDGNFEDFYDYSISYVDEQGKQLVVSGESANKIELGTGGSELIITKKSNDGIISTKILGSREFLRYYRQKPRPSPTNIMIAAATAALASRCKSMGLVTVQSREHLVRMEVLKQMNRSGVEIMRSKIAIKSNVIRNLPRNVPY